LNKKGILYIWQQGICRLKKEEENINILLAAFSASGKEKEI